MFGMGQWELLIIFLVVLLVFGAKRIPEMAQGLGRGIKEFRKAVHEVQEEIQVNEPANRQQASQINPPSQGESSQDGAQSRTAEAARSGDSGEDVGHDSQSSTRSTT